MRVAEHYLFIYSKVTLDYFISNVEWKSEHDFVSECTFVFLRISFKMVYSGLIKPH